jgi:diguanylate cyclase (GGDEF)-like protein
VGFPQQPDEIALKTLFSMLDKRPAKHIWRLTLTMVLVLSGVKVFFGHSVFLDPFYALPITLASWYGSRKTGVALSVISSALLFLIDGFQVAFSVSGFFTYGLPCALSFSALAILITNFRNVHREESLAADTDLLTNILNARGFYAELANELLRSIRYKHTFSLAYLDIDNFKNVNDSKGHAEGDKLLAEVALCLKYSVRATDIVARLGGDEFVLLFPEAEQVESQAAIEKTSKALQARMRRFHWPVSFSIGLVTFETMPTDIKEAMEIADDLMYSVKRGGKNSISYKIWHGKIQQPKPA